MQKSKHIIGILCIVVISFMIIQSPWPNQYIQSLKRDAVTAVSQKSELELQIGKAALDYKKEPKDAVIDPVWKAVPGYNGIEVDREASLKKMKKSGSFDEKKLVFKQTSPNVHLDDLPAAPIYKGNPEKPMVSFAINVAWGEEYLPEMLSVMKKEGVYATFFFEGRWVTKNPELAKMVVESGHEAGNHSFSHPD
ncbi:MAG TPA: polysaccharide deacetylase family protein, partial [Chondromyces sp.]|nr:polysaccharide deacetylase family protein [Chondromyces sp.]